MKKKVLPILILQGWKVECRRYEKLSQLLKQEGFKTYCVDMPGFGNNTISQKELTLDSYVEFVKKFLDKNKIKKTIIVAHSFGGRVGVKLSYQYPNLVEKLILTGVPVIRHVSLKQRILYILAKIGGAMLSIFPDDIKNLSRKILYTITGEWDYYTSGNLKKAFQNIVTESLIGYFKKLVIPVVLIWGENDTFTPVADIKVLKHYLPSLKSIIIKGATHKLPYDDPQKIFEKIMLNL